VAFQIPHPQQQQQQQDWRNLAASELLLLLLYCCCWLLLLIGAACVQRALRAERLFRALLHTTNTLREQIGVSASAREQ
jgi:hypothetical protein